jgi:hypothetical protein
MTRSPSLAWRVACMLLMVCSIGFVLVLFVPTGIAIVFHAFNPSSAIDTFVALGGAIVLAIGSYFMLLNAWHAPRYLRSAWATRLVGELIGLLAGVHYKLTGTRSMSRRS